MLFINNYKNYFIFEDLSGMVMFNYKNNTAEPWCLKSWWEDRELGEGEELKKFWVINPRHWVLETPVPINYNGQKNNDATYGLRFII